MATINKNFKIKNGLVVEGTTATVNGNQILTENASDQYIIGLIGGQTLITSVDTGDFTVNQGNLEIASGSDLARIGDLPTETSQISESIAGPLYYTDGRVKDVLVNATKTNIQISEIAGELHITAENGVADSTTDNLTEGTNNLYFTNSRATSAVSSALGNGISYSGTFDVQIGSGLGFGSYNEITIDRSVVDTWYDASGTGAYEAGLVQTSLDNHRNSTSAHGVTGDVVGTSDQQTLTNKTIADNLTISDGQTSAGTIGATQDGKLAINASQTLYLHSNNANIELVPGQGSSVYINGTSAGNEVATHSYVDNAVSGLAWKESVHLLWDDPNAGLTGSTGTLLIDGHAALTSADSGYRILIKTGANRGIWDYSDDGANWTLTRSADADAVGELVGAAVYVMEGDQYGATSWVQGNHYLSAFTDQTWTQFSGSGSVTAGTGIVVNGLEVSVDFDVVASQTDLSTGLGTKQDTLSEGNGINIVANEVSVDPYDLVGNANDANYIELGIKNGDIAIDKTFLTNYTNTLYDATGAAATAESNANSYTNTALNDYTPTVNLQNTVAGYGFAYTADIPTTTDEISEGTFNHYYTDQRAEDAAGNLLANSNQTNIDISYANGVLTVTAEDGFAGHDTDDLGEGTTNLYFTDSRAISAVSGADITPNTVTIDTYRKEEATQQYVANASTVNVHSPASGFESVKYLVRVVGNITGTKHSQITEILMTVDGNQNIAITEYGNVHTSDDPLATFSAAMVGPGAFAVPTLTATTAVNGCEIIAAATMLSWAD